MRRQIVASNRAGEQVTRIAERLLDLDEAVVRLPKHVRELEDAARMAFRMKDANLYEQEVRKWAGTVRRLGQGAARGPGEYTVRSATQHLVDRLRWARDEGHINQLVDRWVLDRARYQARVIARTESVEAFRHAYERTTSRKPYVKGYKWTLGHGHPRPDVCDVLAGQDLFGLGPGGYPSDETPSTPHPQDGCIQVAIIDRDHFDRELAREQNRPEPPRRWESGRREQGQDWLGRQSERTQRELLGPTRFRMMQQGTQVLRQDGTPIPVFELLGQPRPVRGMGPPVAVRPLVRADRATMVEPFPRPPQLPQGDTGRSR